MHVPEQLSAKVTKPDSVTVIENLVNLERAIERAVGAPFAHVRTNLSHVLRPAADNGADVAIELIRHLAPDSPMREGIMASYGLANTDFLYECDPSLV